MVLREAWLYRKCRCRLRTNDCLDRQFIYIYILYNYLLHVIIPTFSYTQFNASKHIVSYEWFPNNSEIYNYIQKHAWPSSSFLSNICPCQCGELIIVHCALHLVYQLLDMKSLFMAYLKIPRDFYWMQMSGKSMF